MQSGQDNRKDQSPLQAIREYPGQTITPSKQTVASFRSSFAWERRTHRTRTCLNGAGDASQTEDSPEDDFIVTSPVSLVSSQDWRASGEMTPHGGPREGEIGCEFQAGRSSLLDLDGPNQNSVGRNPAWEALQWKASSISGSPRRATCIGYGTKRSRPPSRARWLEPGVDEGNLVRNAHVHDGQCQESIGCPAKADPADCGGGTRQTPVTTEVSKGKQPNQPPR